MVNRRRHSQSGPISSRNDPGGMTWYRSSVAIASFGGWRRMAGIGTSASLLDARRRSADRFESSRSPSAAGPAPSGATLQTFGSGTESDRREPGIYPVISSVTCRELGCLPNMIQPPLLGVVKAASAVSAQTPTCRAPAVPRSCSMLSVYMAIRVRPFPKLPPLEQNGCGPSTLMSPA